MPLIRIENYPPGCDLGALATTLRKACVAANVPGIDSVELVTVVAGGRQLITDDSVLVLIVEGLFDRPDRTKDKRDGLAVLLGANAKLCIAGSWKVEVLVKRFNTEEDSYFEIY